MCSGSGGIEWNSIMKEELMSSEESCEVDGEEGSSSSAMAIGVVEFN